MKQPEKMTFAMIRQAINEASETHRSQSYITDDFIMTRATGAFFNSIVEAGRPYRIDDYRCAIVLGGEIHSVVNLVERRIGANTIILLTPGTLVQLQHVTPDFQIFGMASKSDLVHVALGGQLPAAIALHARDYRIAVSKRDVQPVFQLFECIWSLIHSPHFSAEAHRALIAAQLHQYNHLIERGEREANAHQSNERHIFDRFIQLVNCHAATEHRLAYYAHRMCITERYLSTVVKQASGNSAKEWIDRAVITEAKVMLKHSNQPVGQIADALAMPSSSFFCKYFKRLTGLTPQQYRAE
ncbi:MAG: helix-turn-helix transcriptional regulator [Prevotella sp.]|nr:helix-turn-helix transcriptional regulator [Prevotella sp.]